MTALFSDGVDEDKYDEYDNDNDDDDDDGAVLSDVAEAFPDMPRFSDGSLLTTFFVKIGGSDV